MSKRLQIKPGDEYDRLTVLREVEPKMSGKVRQRCVECECVCGTVKGYRLCSLRSGNTRSCGCLAEEVAGSNLKTHGLSGTPEYRIWLGMLSRCNNSGNHAYRHYGGRGIAVCERWSNSFEDFLEDMGARPSRNHSLDRYPDNDGNYEPGNCRWATKKQQSRNTRVNYLVEHNGETKCVADWAEQYGFRPEILYGRLVSLGWTFEKSVSWPVYKRSAARSRDPFYQTPIKERGADWQREHARREVRRIASDRQELERHGDSLAKTHRVDAPEFKSRVDSALSEGWTWNGAVLRALREMGAVK